nr:DUF4998 domain-containing protein [Pedobacter panaciterrae]
MKTIKYFTSIFFVATCLFITSCTKEDDYKKYTVGGEITYPARIDSVIVQSGNQRARLRLALGSDPSITRVKVFWNNRADSAEANVVRTQAIDTINMIIENLNEGVYNFDVYTYNNKNNVSVVKHGSGNVYGENYASTLANRTIQSLTQGANGNVLINWFSPLTGEKEIELKYKNSKGQEITQKVPADAMSTEIMDYKDKSLLSWRSFFLPDSNAFDSFTLDYSTVELPEYERQLPKSGFSEKILPTDVLEGGFGWLMPFLWNDTYTGNGFATQPGKLLPVSFTFDTGVSYRINRFKYWMPQDRIFKLEAVKTFEIWGSNNPAADGSWTSWTLLRTCESIKPSGSPVGTNTDADVAAAAAGQEFVMPDGTPKTRFIRIKVLSNWGNGSFQALGEFTFYTKEH